MSLEPDLSRHLLVCAAAYGHAHGLSLPTLGRLAASERRVFEHVSHPKRTFTIRKYDDVIQWFPDRWPSGLTWPQEDPRPEPKPPAARPRRRVRCQNLASSSPW